MTASLLPRYVRGVLLGPLRFECDGVLSGIERMPGLLVAFLVRISCVAPCYTLDSVTCCAGPSFLGLGAKSIVLHPLLLGNQGSTSRSIRGVCSSGHWLSCVARGGC